MLFPLVVWMEMMNKGHGQWSDQLRVPRMALVKNIVPHGRWSRMEGGAGSRNLPYMLTMFISIQIVKNNTRGAMGCSDQV